MNYLFFLCQAISVSPSTSLLVRTCWPYTDRLSDDHTVLSSHVALTCDNSTVGQQQLHQEHWPRMWQQKSVGYVQPAAAGAPAACVAYSASGPCHGALWTTRRQTNSPTDQLADSPTRRQQTRRQTNSPTIKLALDADPLAAD